MARNYPRMSGVSVGCGPPSVRRSSRGPLPVTRIGLSSRVRRGSCHWNFPQRRSAWAFPARCSASRFGSPGTIGARPYWSVHYGAYVAPPARRSTPSLSLAIVLRRPLRAMTDASSRVTRSPESEVSATSAFAIATRTNGVT